MEPLINPTVLNAITHALAALRTQQAALEMEIATLEKEGCLDGFIKQTPTGLELHYRRSLRQPQPPPSRVITPAEETAVRVQLENHILLTYLQDHLKEIEFTIERTTRGFEEIKSYVESRCNSFAKFQPVKSGNQAGK